MSPVPMPRRVRVVLAAGLALLAVATNPALAGELFRAGYVQISTGGDAPVPVSVWYPTTVPEAPFMAGPFLISATPGAPPAPGRHRLVVLSHGHLGNDLGHRDLAEHLARHGVVVAAPRHLGDSYDQPPTGDFRQFLSRPAQIVATINAVLADARLGLAIDPERIGMAGFSAGGYTTLVVAGAEPKFDLFVRHCLDYPDDEGLCEVVSKRGPLKRDWEHWRFAHERRVKAAVAMAPVGVVFDAEGLKGVAIPLRVYKAKDDQVLYHPYNFDHVVSGLPKTPETATVEGGHYVFLPPCPAAVEAHNPTICRDAPGVDRAAVHRRINAEILDFFDRTLGKD